MRIICGVDGGVTDLADADYLARAMCEGLAGHGLSTPWVLTHWVEPAGAGSMHLALSLQIAATASVDAVSAALRDQVHRLSEDDVLFGGVDEVGIAILAGDALVEFTGLTGLSAGARDAAEAHESGSAGRAVNFPGSDRVGASMSIAELTATTAVVEVTGLADIEVRSTTRLFTRGHLRPVMRSGRLVLPVVPGPDGSVLPFEVPEPTPCCAAHVVQVGR